MENKQSDKEQDDSQNFEYKKNKFTQRTQEEPFDVDMPNDHDWFDAEPIKSTKKIKETHLIHPKIPMTVKTVASSLRDPPNDIRGDIVNPKLNVGPWMQSSIEPDTNIKGICNSI
uniref:Minor capsid protein P11 C-terminal conserved region domain-containing protein n=1 Tax=viral metagenome TaxID=1070528 RepID=A0A6C0CBH8_9ZZZZ